MRSVNPTWVFFLLVILCLEFPVNHWKESFFVATLFSESFGLVSIYSIGTDNFIYFFLVFTDEGLCFHLIFYVFFSAFVICFEFDLKFEPWEDSFFVATLFWNHFNWSPFFPNVQIILYVFAFFYSLNHANCLSR